MDLVNQNIQLPSIRYNMNDDNGNDVIPHIAYDLYQISDGLQKTIENVQQISSDSIGIKNIKDYVDNEIEFHTKRIAERTYDIISEMIDCNMRKEEFVKLLLSEESL